MRLDQYLVEQHHFDSRAHAQSAIRAGLVHLAGAPVLKPSHRVQPNDAITIHGDPRPYVSRGALKLIAALDAFSIEATNRIALDLGASTGGFTEVLLDRGARQVFAVDVGHGQLHERLRADPRVVTLEKTHARDLTAAIISEAPDLIVCDVSFISLRKALPAAFALAGDGAVLAALIKPQFELGQKAIGKGGLVKATDAALDDLCDEIAGWLDAIGWSVIGCIDSPIPGGDGNREFLIGARKKA